ncbi:MAG TPA: DUF1552 domain-containing protein [Gammaproteobacteria bacterium]|nr:DUF1552 domain-containing protein [Gammaproteobacteria bacterium]
MRIITGKRLSRRALLKGAGAAVSLPLLESMLPAGRAWAENRRAPTVRAGFFYIPHGATMSRWTPARDGKDFELSEILKPLEPYKDRINIVSDLSHPQAYGPGGATAHHNRSSAVFLSGAKAQEGPVAHLGVTVDQVIAKAIGQETPLPSLELMIDEGSTSCGDGLSCAYRNTISWQTPTSPLPMENNPQVVFERLFGDGGTDEERRARRSQSLSLLDAVAGQINSLARTLPNGDRARLDLFLTDVREIERRIEQAAARSSENLDVPARPSGIPENVEEHIKLMMDLEVLAWQADITRVTTFLIACELSNTVYPASSIREAFHILSHHSNIEANKAKFAVLNRYHVGLLAYFLGKLAASPDGDGTLLDHSVVLYGSGMSDGNQHNHGPLPVVLAGSAAGALATGRHLRNADGTTMSNLLLSLLHTLDIEQESFGDSTDPLAI